MFPIAREIVLFRNASQFADDCPVQQWPFFVTTKFYDPLPARDVMQNWDNHNDDCKQTQRRIFALDASPRPYYRAVENILKG